MFGLMYRMEAETVEALEQQVQEGVRKFYERTNLKADLVGLPFGFLPEMKAETVAGCKVRRLHGVVNKHVWVGVEHE